MSIVREWMSMKYKIPRMQESADQGDVLDLQSAHLTCHLPLCSAFLSLGHRQTPNPFCYEGRPRNTPFQSAMPFRAVLRAKLPDDPLAAAKRVWIPGPQPDYNPTILVLLREDPPPYALHVLVTSHLSCEPLSRDKTKKRTGRLQQSQ